MRSYDAVKGDELWRVDGMHFQCIPSPVVMGVPRAQVILRTLQLPVIPDVRELASMVHFQIGRDLPFRMEDAVVDFKVRRQIRVPAARPEAGVPAGPSTGDKPAESAPTAKLEVLVAVLKREVVEYYLQVAEIAGLKLVALGLLAYANARCVDACRVADGAEAFALVSLRPDEVSIDVIAEQSLLFSRGASIRLFADAPATPTPDTSSLVRTDPVVDSSAEAPKGDGSGFTDAVTIEVVRSLHGFSGMEADNPVGKVVVTEKFVLKVPESLDPAAAAPLLCAGITTFSPLRQWNCKKGDRVGVVGLGGLGHMAVKLASAMGAEVTSGGMLLPRSHQPRYSAEPQIRPGT